MKYQYCVRDIATDKVCRCSHLSDECEDLVQAAAKSNRKSSQYVHWVETVEIEGPKPPIIHTFWEKLYGIIGCSQ